MDKMAQSSEMVPVQRVIKSMAYQVNGANIFDPLPKVFPHSLLVTAQSTSKYICCRVGLHEVESSKEPDQIVEVELVINGLVDFVPNASCQKWLTSKMSDE